MTINDICFQIIDWTQDHELETDIEDSDDPDNVSDGPDNDSDKSNKETTELLCIRLFGKTDDNKSICLNTNFTPYFYVKIPSIWNNTKAQILVSHIKSNISNKNALSGLVSFDVVNKKDFRGFTAGTDFKFIRFVFKNMKSYKCFEYWIEKNKIKNTFLFPKETKLSLYESNIQPLIRCMHIRKLNACGWVKISNYTHYKDPLSFCDINIRTPWTELIPYDSNMIQKFVIASFDIECMSESGNFPEAKNDNDPIIQIGTVFSYYGESEPFYKHIITLNGCTKIPALEDVDIVSYKQEKNVLLAWTKLIQRMNPDIITGYNINGFDFGYMKGRAEKFNILPSFSKLSRIIGETAPWEEKVLSSSALGDNLLKYFNMNGRIIIDLMKVLQRDAKLDSYKLDSVSAFYIKESIKKINYLEESDETEIMTSSIYGIKDDQYISILYNDGLTDNKLDQKFKITRINKEAKIIAIKGTIEEQEIFASPNKIYWCHAKDDVTPNELFKLFKGSDDDRAIIAKYCLQDCILVIKLLEKLQVINNNIGMSNVCHVPLSYIFTRGQGIKIFSLVAKKCRELNHLMPKLKYIEKKKDSEGGDDEVVGYEGATVFPPITGVHYEPIPVLDYASLYPRSMIYKNISHECIVLEPKYDNLADYNYHTVSYKNNDNTTTTCRYAKKKDNSMGILPLILVELLDKRSATKKLMDKTESAFTKNILDGLQLAYKVTANSLYGQVGAPTSPIYLKELAASTTATGREMLEFSRDFIQGPFGHIINLALENKEEYIKESNKVFSVLDALPKKFINPRAGYNNRDEYIEYFYNKINSCLKQCYRVSPVVIYGDTDSVFFSPKIRDIDTNRIKTDKDALIMCIEIGQLAGEAICKILPEPEEQVYEKTLWPFIILSKKRYVGNLYETDPNNSKQKSMGIVLKRRDNAKIVKIVVGGIVNKILNERSNEGAIEYTRTSLKKILKNEFPIDKFIISKTLKGTYKDRTRIVHAILADRIAQRDPGNKPDVNDRIPWVYIVTKGKVELQGERVEDPNYVIKNNLEIDYLFYITNQIMKPSLQFLELIATNSEKIFDNVIHKEINRRKNVSSIFHYMKQSMDTEDTVDINTNTDIGIGSSKKVLNNKKSFLTLDL
jgi:DNA polymerase elongation subunit (family B)